MCIMHNFTRNNLFLAVLALLTFVSSLLLPSTTRLLHPDSSGYIDFFEFRTSFYPVFLDIFSYFGLSIEQIPIVQVLIFSLSLYYLLRSLSNMCIKKISIFLYVVALVGNIWFISLHKAILTESLYISLNIIAVSSLINFLFNGHIKHLFLFSLTIGLAMGVRPSGVALVALMPIILLSAYIRFKKFNWSWIAVLIVPLFLTQIAERGLHYKYHGKINRTSIMDPIIFGKGAMIEGSFQYSGPYKNILEEYSSEVDLEFREVRSFIEKIPFFWLKNQSLPNYELYAQFQLLRNRHDFYAEKASVSKHEIMRELGKQRIYNGIDQLIKNSLYYYAGSWGLRVTTFPYFVKEYNEWALEQSKIPKNTAIPYLPLKGELESSIVSMIAFPGLLLAGVISGLIGIIFLIMLLLRREIPLYFMLSGILSVSVHGMLFFYSFVNIATPRYTIAQFPILLLVFFFFFLWVSPVVKKWIKTI